MKCYVLTVSLLFAFLAPKSQTPNGGARALPSRPQQEWAEAEIGAIFHLDVTNYVPDYDWRKWGTHPPASVFNPSKLNTDQWVSAAKAAGAKYAVLVAKHCSGFSLWPTAAHAYSVKSSPWKNGQGDIVRDFIASCKKYGLRPGIYASAAANGYCWVDNPGKVQPGGPMDQQQYNKIVIQQLTELWSHYGKLFEIWFDGGVQPVEDGGPDIAPLLQKLQPDAVVFQGPSTARNLLRWIGNESGLAPYPNWSTTNVVINANGTLKQDELAGDPDGKIWCPGETDFPLRSGWQGGWFWKGNDQTLMSREKLIDNYLTSVGRNSNMLIGIVVDTSGLVPNEDVALLKEFGEQIRAQFSHPIASIAGDAQLLEIKLPKGPSRITGYLLREKLEGGERIRRYRLEGLVDGKWKAIGEGTSVGNKHIEKIEPVIATAVRLNILSSTGQPLIKAFSVF